MCTFAAAKRGVAQLVAFLVWDQAVAGSSPVAPTKVKTIVLNVSTIVFLYLEFAQHLHNILYHLNLIIFFEDDLPEHLEV